MHRGCTGKLPPHAVLLLVFSQVKQTDNNLKAFTSEDQSHLQKSPDERHLLKGYALSKWHKSTLSINMLLRCLVCAVRVQLLQSGLTVSDPMNCSPPGSFVHGIFQARILEWVAKLSSRGSSQTRDRNQVSCIAGEFFTSEPLGRTMFAHWET